MHWTQFTDCACSKHFLFIASPSTDCNIFFEGLEGDILALDEEVPAHAFGCEDFGEVKKFSIVAWRFGVVDVDEVLKPGNTGTPLFQHLQKKMKAMASSPFDVAGRLFFPASPAES